MRRLVYVMIALFLINAGHIVNAQIESGFSIERMVVATGIENREPVDIRDTFSAATEKVYCFIEARNIKEDTNITVVWSNNGKEVLRTSLPLKKGSRWRTYAEKRLYGMRGEWKVDILDNAGNFLKAVTFKVE
ncbi:MAG: DUF2914 domain-containing protein [Thermodesulfovibrionales bacterium]|nr:DUF2914 domain-containing protein [Thermodesulfovibrionales bacterium]